MVFLRTVDPLDDDALHAAWAAYREGASAGRTAPLVTTWASFRTSMQQPSPWGHRTLLAAYESDVHERPLGAALLALPTRDNQHLAELEIAVLPRHRGRGIGEALFDEGLAQARAGQRSTFVCELFVDAGLEIDDAPGGRFALRHGYASVHREDHLVLPLSTQLPAVEQPDGYQVRSWQDDCPDELVPAYSEMRDALEQALPGGGLDREPRRWDVERIRENEQRMRTLGYTSLVSVAETDSGELGGYTLILVPGHDSTDVLQEDTMVATEHRGHGLGATLKAANMTVLADRFPGRRMLHTWTAGVNGAMQAINKAFGFRLAETMHEVQLVDGGDTTNCTGSRTPGKTTL